MPLGMFSFIVAAVAFITSTPLVLCRTYEFPMCPPKEWKVPGGKITTSGQVEYKLICHHNYIRPLMHNRSTTFVCSVGERYEELPRRCIPKIFARVTLEYGMSIGISPSVSKKSTVNFCGNTTVLNRIRQFKFKSTKSDRNNDADSPQKMGGSRVINGNRNLEGMRVKISKCHNVRDDEFFLVVRIMQVLKGNGTDDDVNTYYNFIVSETFKALKQMIQSYGYIFKKNFSNRDVSLTKGKLQALSLTLGFADRAVRDLFRSNDVSPLFDTASTENGRQYPADAGNKLDLGDYDMGFISEAYAAKLSRGPTAELYVGDQDHVDDAQGVSPRLAGIGVAISAEAMTARTQKGDTTYEGLKRAVKGDILPVEFNCPSHLELVETKQEKLCVGCGKGWFLRKLPGKSQSDCYPCGPGFYNDLDTARECKPCPIKYTNAPWDAGSIDDCFKMAMSEYERKKWTFLGYLAPCIYIGVMSLLVAWISKVTVGTSTYERKGQNRKSAKPTNTANQELST